MHLIVQHVDEYVESAELLLVGVVDAVGLGERVADHELEVALWRQEVALQLAELGQKRLTESARLRVRVALQLVDADGHLPLRAHQLVLDGVELRARALLSRLDVVRALARVLEQRVLEAELRVAQLLRHVADLMRERLAHRLEVVVGDARQLGEVLLESLLRVLELDLGLFGRELALEEVEEAIARLDERKLVVVAVGRKADVHEALRERRRVSDVREHGLAAEHEDDAHGDLLDVGLVEHGGDLADGYAHEQVEYDDAHDGDEEAVDEVVDVEAVVEAHLVRVEVADDHGEGAHQAQACRVGVVADAEVGAQAEGEEEADVDDEEDGHELGRVGERALEGHDVEADDAHLLDEEREDDVGEEDGERAVGELGLHIARHDGEYSERVGAQLAPVGHRRHERQAVDEGHLRQLLARYERHHHEQERRHPRVVVEEGHQRGVVVVVGVCACCVCGRVVAVAVGCCCWQSCEGFCGRDGLLEAVGDLDRVDGEDEQVEEVEEYVRVEEEARYEAPLEVEQHVGRLVLDDRLLAGARQQHERMRVHVAAVGIDLAEVVVLAVLAVVQHQLHQVPHLALVHGVQLRILLFLRRLRCRKLKQAKKQQST